MENTKLKKSSMSFQLKDGTILLISNEDIQEIAGKIVLEAILNGNCKINISKNHSLEKCDLLYRIVREQGSSMDDEQKRNYLKAIYEFISTGTDFDFENDK